MKKKKLITALSAGLLIAGGLTLASCTNKGATTTQTEEETTSDLYYYASDSEDYLLSIIGNKFSLTGFGGTYTGTLSKNGTAAALTFKNNAADGEITYLSDGSISLTFNGGTYTFLKRTSYEVTYVVDGVTYESSSVINGKKATKPADPEKEGSVFIGWYTDREYTTQFLFDYNSITEDTTLYARFVDTAGALEFEVTFVDGTTMTSAKTEAGMVINFPETKEDFVGWYYSSNGDTTKLSTKYEGETLKENTTLYAVYKSENPIISVKDGNISWTSVGTNLTYELKVTSPSGTVTSRSVNATSFGEYKFTEAGCYTITVSANGKSTTVYYTNKQLAKVSNFNVVAGSVLMFNSVENATKYLITIDCGNKEHNHKDIDLGNTTYFDFSNCQMQEGGIKFTVKAVANGYVTSISEEYSYELNLDVVTGLKVDTKTGYATWNKVENALSYKVEVTVDDKTYVTTTTDTNFSLKEYTGTIKIAVTPVTEGYNSPEATNTTYEKTILATPVNVKLEGKKLTWDTVDNAKSYNVYINGKEYKGITINSFTVTNDMLDDSVTDYEFSVVAVAEDSKNNSKESDAVYASTSKLDGTLTYKNKCVSWNGVLNADHYLVQVDSDTKVSTTETFADIEFKRAGYHIIKVSSVSATGVESDPIMIEVYVNSITFNSNSGVAVDSAYYAVGDTVTLPTTTKPGYDLEGWYNIANGAEAFGKKYQDGFTMGATSLTLYANWTPKKYTVTFETNQTGISGTLVGDTAEVTVAFNQSFKLPVAESSDESYAFAGWYTQINGQGKKYADNNGNSVVDWAEAQDTKLYAYYAEIVSYEEITDKDGNITGYTASKGDGIGYVSEVTVLAEYKGKPVTAIGMFNSISTLKVLNIPDTVTYINTDTGFVGLSQLTEINMYETGTLPSNYEYIYKTYNGVLYHNNTESDVAGWEVKLVPTAMAGVVDVMEGTVVIPLKAFASHSKITAVNIPYTVTNIEKQAFYSMSSLVEINFVGTTDESVVEPTLTIAELAFQSNKGLTSVTLPRRLETFDLTMFDSCANLESVYIEEGSLNYTSKSGVLCSKDGSQIVYCPKGKSAEFTIPTGVTSVANEAFKACIALTKVIIPNYVKEIGVSAFQGCTKLTEIVFEGDEDSVDLTIKECAFYGCTALTEISIPVNTISVGAHAFGGASKLTKVNVYTNRENFTIADEATAQNTSTTGTNYSYVTDVYIGANVPVFSISGAFAGYNDVLANVEVDPNNKNYTNLDGVLFDKDVTELLFYSKDKAGSYVIPSTVTKISAGSFRKRTKLTSITIPASVTTIEDSAFSGCSGLLEVIFEKAEDESQEKELTIGAGAFRYCSSLTEINIPSRTSTIGEYGLANMAKITSIVIPEGVTKIGSKAFYSCTRLTSISLPFTLTVMESYDSTSKSYVEFGSNSTVALDIIDNCSALDTIIVADGNEKFYTKDSVLYIKENGVVTQLATIARNHSGAIVIPKTVNTIWPKAFYFNKLITSVTFEDGKSAVTTVDGKETEGTLTVGEQAFYYCSGVTEVSLPNVTEISKQMFYYCSSLKSFNVARTVKKIGQGAFYSCTSLTSVTFEEQLEGTSEAEIPELEFESATSSTGGAFYNTSVQSIAFPERTTVIGNYLLYSNKYLKSICIPSTVTKIGSSAFYMCTNVSNFEMAENAKLEEIGSNAFYKLPIKKLVLNEGLKTIGSYAFSYTELEEVVIPSTVTKLDSYSFQHNTKLEKITFTDTTENPSKLTEIGSSAFTYCTALKTITIPSSVETINASAFAFDSALTEIKYDSKKIKKIGNYAFRATGFTEFTFPTYYNDNGEVAAYPTSGTAQAMGTKLFAGCKNLKTVTLSASVAAITDVFNSNSSIENIIVVDENENLKVDDTYPMIVSKDGSTIKYIFGTIENQTFVVPDSVTTIEKNAFYQQENIRSIIVHSKVTTIASYAFNECTNLLSVEFDSNSTLTTLNTYTFNNCKNLKTVKLPTTLTKIDNYTFYHCDSLEEIEIPAGVTSIGNYAFGYCYSLKSITIPSKVKTIGNDAFGYCQSLTSITIPTTVTSIGTYALEYCTSLVTANINAKVTTLSNSLFSHCESLTNVTLPSTVKTFGTYVFAYCSSIGNVTIPSKVTTLPNNTFYYAGGESITLPSTITSLGNYVFAYSTFKSITIPNTIKTIGTYEFKACEAQTIKFEENNTGLTTLGNYAFTSLVNAETIVLPDHLKFTGTYAFQNASVKNVILPETLTSIGQYAFDGCSKLEEITIPKNVITIGGATATGTVKYSSFSYAFRSCKNLKKVTFEEGSKLTAITGNTFYQCESLEEIVNLPSTVTEIGTNAFRNTAIKEIDLSNVTTLGTYVVANCPNLAKVKLNSTLTSIPNFMFYYCTSLETIDLPSSVTSIGTRAFSYSGLKSIDLSNVTTLGDYSLSYIDIETIDASSVTSIGTYAFDNCTKLTSITLNDNLEVLPEYALRNTQKLESITLPTSLKTIGKYCFSYSAISKIEIPASVKELPIGCFNYCTNLSYVGFLGDNVTTFGSNVFNHCTSLKRIELPTSLTTMGDYVFHDAGLSEIVTIPSSFSKAGYNPFAGCTNLPGVKVEDGNGDYKSGAYGELYSASNQLIYFPEAKLQALYLGNDSDGTLDMNNLKDSSGNILEGVTILQNAFERCDYILKIILPNDMEELGNQALELASCLKEVVLPSGLKTIAKDAFKDAGSGLTPKGEIAGDGDGTPTLTKLIIPNTVDTIEELAFENSYFTSIEFESGSKLEVIPKDCFKNSSVLETVILPDSVTEIATYAFQLTTNLVSVNIPTNAVLSNNTFYKSGIKNVTLSKQNLSTEATYIFQYATGIESVTFEEGVTVIPTYMFYHAVINNVTFPSTLETVDKDAFAYSTIKNAEFKEGLKSIESSAFAYATELESVTLPTSLEKIDTYAFQKTNIKNVIIPEGVDTVGSYAFTDCLALESITLPSSLTTLGNNAFQNDTLIKSIVLDSSKLLSVGSNIFKNWTSEQTIYITGDEKSTSDWTTSWANACEANIVYNYNKA